MSNGCGPNPERDDLLLSTGGARWTPTPADLRRTRETLAWLHQWISINEPYAVLDLRAIEETADALPADAQQLGMEDES
jgi:hypothetical protein